MRIITRYKHVIYMIVIAWFAIATSPVHAVTAIATVEAKVTHFLAMTNTSAMSFGEISINSVAGAVTLKVDGTRESTGGAMLSGNGSYSPAKFVIEGAQNGDYSVSFPDEVIMTDGFGNTLIVNEIKSEQFVAGSSGDDSLKELVLGAKLNLEAYQAAGSYSGSLVVEVEYR